MTAVDVSFSSAIISCEMDSLGGQCLLCDDWRPLGAHVSAARFGSASIRSTSSFTINVDGLPGCIVALLWSMTLSC